MSLTGLKNNEFDNLLLYNQSVNSFLFLNSGNQVVTQDINLNIYTKAQTDALLLLKSNVDSPTFTTKITTPVITLSGATATKLLLTDATKSVISSAYNISDIPILSTNNTFTSTNTFNGDVYVDTRLVNSFELLRNILYKFTPVYDSSLSITNPSILSSSVSNAVQITDGNWSATVYLPAADGTIPHGQPYYINRNNNGGYPTTVNKSRTNMTADLIMSGNYTNYLYVFIYNGYTSLYEYQGYLKANTIPVPNQFNGRNNSFTLPVTREIGLLSSDGNGGTSWSNNYFTQAQTLALNNLTNYTTTLGTNTLITNALVPYVLTSTLNSTLLNYSTTFGTNTLITNAIAIKSNSANPVFTGVITLPNGPNSPLGTTPRAPVLTFSGNTNCGLFSSATNNIDFTTSDAIRLNIAPDGNVSVYNNLTVKGNISAFSSNIDLQTLTIYSGIFKISTTGINTVNFICDPATQTNVMNLSPTKINNNTATDIYGDLRLLNSHSLYLVGTGTVTAPEICFLNGTTSLQTGFGYQYLGRDGVQLITDGVSRVGVDSSGCVATVPYKTIDSGRVNPSYTFTSSPNSGMYYNNNSVGFCVGGNDMMLFTTIVNIYKPLTLYDTLTCTTVTASGITSTGLVTCATAKINSPYIQLGYSTGANTGTVMIGNGCGQTNPPLYSVAIGYGSTQTSAVGLTDTIGIGRFSSQTNNYSNTICINATGSVINPAGANRCYVAPIRSSTTAYTAIQYDTVNKELVAYTSSKRFKKNINEKVLNCDDILKLKTVSFDAIDDNIHNPCGLIAEDCFKINPDFACLDGDGVAISVNYFNILTYAIEKIKSQQIEIDELKKRGKTALSSEPPSSAPSGVKSLSREERLDKIESILNSKWGIMF